MTRVNIDTRRRASVIVHPLLHALGWLLRMMQNLWSCPSPSQVRTFFDRDDLGGSRRVHIQQDIHSSGVSLTIDPVFSLVELIHAEHS